MNSSYYLEKNKDFGFYQILPTPTREEIEKFYTEEFYSSEYKKCNDSSLEIQLEDKEFYRGTWFDLANKIKSLLQDIENIKILDVGCGWAQALLFFKDHGFDCYGFDPAPEAVNYAIKKGINVALAGLGKMNVFDGIKFDVVTLMNVLEHLPNPYETLLEIRKDVISPGGILVIDVPNEFNVFQTIGQKVHSLDQWWVAPPGHLNYFDKDSLSNLMRASGFKIEYMHSSFPIEMFLLFGENYVNDSRLGKICHKKRVNFESNMRKYGATKQLSKLYEVFANLGIGRQLTIYGRAI